MWMVVFREDHGQQLKHQTYSLNITVYSPTLLWTLLQHVLVLVVMDCQFNSNMLKTQHSAAFLALCNSKVTLLTAFPKTTSQKVMQGGSKASTVHTERTLV